MGEVSLERVFAKHGEVTKMVVDRRKCCTVVVYDSVETAKDAMASIKGSFIGKSRVPAVVSVGVEGCGGCGDKKVVCVGVVGVGMRRWCVCVWRGGMGVGRREWRVWGV